MMYLGAVLLGTLVLCLRAADLPMVVGGLWGEDGSIFINQAARYGLDSVLIPYAGYLHLYPRLVSLLAIQLPLRWIPYVFNFAWFLAYLLMAWIMVRKGRAASMGVFAVLLLPALVVLLPQNGEIYFTVTNSQWFLAVALAVYLCVPLPQPIKWHEAGLLLAIALTGPFALILTPLLLLRAILLRDYRENKGLYIAIILGALLQLLFVVTSQRLEAAGGIDTHVYDWIRAVVRFIAFGGVDGILPRLSALLFWLALTYSVMKAYMEGNMRADRMRHVPMLSIAAAFLLMFATIAALFRHDPMALVGGTRYYFIPYAMILFAAFVAGHKYRLAHVVMIVAAIVIGIVEFRQVERDDLQWPAFVRFAEVKLGIMIPIPPQLKDYPGWHVQFASGDGRSLAQQSGVVPFEIELRSVSSHGNSIRARQLDHGEIGVDVGTLCQDKLTVGVEMQTVQYKPGWLRVSWGAQEEPAHRNSLRRYYPAGEVSPQFAYQRKLTDTELRVGYEEGDVAGRIATIWVYCLDGD